MTDEQASSPDSGPSGSLLSVRQLADGWSTSEQVVRRLLHSGELRGVKIGRSWRVFPEDAKAYVASRMNVSRCDAQ